MVKKAFMGFAEICMVEQERQMNAAKVPRLPPIYANKLTSLWL